MDEEFSFGAWVRRRRRALDLTQAALAQQVGCAAITIRKIEADDFRPSLQVAELLADHLEIPTTERPTFLRVARAEQAVDQLGAAAQMPRPASGTSRPTNLPLQLTSFVGRTRELAELAVLCTKQRLITLTGEGGAGKTRLALQVAGAVLANFKGGGWLVELAPIREPALVPQTVATTLGVTERSGDLVADLCAALRDQRLLLVLDNCEHLLSACADLVAALLGRCPRLCILATGRAPLNLLGEQCYPLDPLPVPLPDTRTAPAALAQVESVQLFAERAHAASPSFTLSADNARHVAEICHRLDGLPLAIELAAAQVRHLTLAALAERLQAPLALLVRGPRNLPPRQQTLRATLAWSYEMLGSGQALFARMGVFVGGCTIEAAEAIAGDPGVAALPDLAALVEQSMLRRQDDATGQPRLVMLETIRSYALEQLELRGELAELRWRHVRYYIAQSQDARIDLTSERQLAWIGWIKQEQYNLRAALAWVLSCGDVEAAAALGAVLSPLWAFGGQLNEGRLWLERILACELPTPVNTDIARCRMFLGKILALQGRHEEALVLFGQADHDCAVLGNSELRASVNDWCSAAYKLLGEYKQALDWLQRQLERAQAGGNTYEIGSLLNDIGLAYEELGEHERALPYFQQGLQLIQQGGKPTLSDKLLGNLGQAYEALGDYASAVANFEECYALSRQLNFQIGMYIAVGYISYILLEQGYYDLAGACMQLHLELSIAAENLLTTGVALAHLALLAGEQRRYADADLLWQASLPLQRQSSPPYYLCYYLLMYATSLYSQARHAEAQRHNQEARQIAEEYDISEIERDSELLALQLGVALGQFGREHALNELAKLDATDNDLYNRAALAYTAWQIDRSREENRQAAIAGYRALLARTPKVQHAQRYTTLTGEPIALPITPLTLSGALPLAADRAPLDVPALLRRIKLLLRRVR